MTKSYEERMAEKYNFLKKDEDINKTQPTIKKNITQISKYIKESDRIIKTTVIIVVLKKLSLINRNELFSRDLTYFNKQMTRLVQTNVHSLELFHFLMQHN